MTIRRFEPTVQLDSGLIIPAAAGAGKRLQSDASGNATWVNNPSAAFPNLLMPLTACVNPLPDTSKVIGTAFRAYFQRAIVPITGKLKDFSVPNGATVAGETRVAIFDTGDATAGKYTLLAQSAATAMAGANVWQSLGSLGELALTAGQHILMGIMTTSATATFGYYKGREPTTGGIAELPANYLPAAGGATPKLIGNKTYGSLEFSTITEAELLTNSPLAFSMLGRIT